MKITKSMLSVLFVLSATGGCLPAGAQAASVRQQARPNVLFISVDDLNDWIGVLGGHPDARTPNFDRLARRGTLFRRAYTAAPVCNPSRAALLTGVRPSTSGIYSNWQALRVALPDVVTLPQLFMRHGYDVVGRGKIFHPRYEDAPSWRDFKPKADDGDETVGGRDVLLRGRHRRLSKVCV